MIEEKYGTSDEHNPEWTAEKFARSMKLKDLPESLQSTLSERKLPEAPTKEPTPELSS